MTRDEILVMEPGRELDICSIKQNLPPEAIYPAALIATLGVTE